MEKHIKKIAKYTDSELQEYFFTEKITILHQIKLILDNMYTNIGNSYFTDFQYDMLKDTMIKIDPSYIPEIGSVIRVGDNRIKLPYYMGSLSKIKPENLNELNRWKDKFVTNEYIIEDKLDGVSALFINKNHSINMYTRGDGIIGGDISHLLSYINLPVNINCNIAIRGELIINKNIFEEKYRLEYSNPRNMVVGIIGSKKIREGIKDINFIAYEIVDFEEKLTPLFQLHFLKELGFNIVNNIVIDNVDIENLSNIFVDFKEKSQYDIDGIVIQPNILFERNTSGNSSYILAFKMNLYENSVVSEVVNVLWNVSKWGILKPRIQIVPVRINGVTISYSSGFNAKFIYNNKIGPGTIVRITRSGDVIPYITDVISCSKDPKMPDIPYIWNETNVDIISKDDINIKEIKKISSFLSNLGVKHVSEATISKIYFHGFTTIQDIFSASKEDFNNIDGFGSKLSERTYENIHKCLQNVELANLLGCSGMLGFGIGTKKIKSLLKSIPEILNIYKNHTHEEMVTMIIRVEGFSNKTANKIIENLQNADTFIQSISSFIKIKNTEFSINLQNIKVCITGFRDKILEEYIIKHSGKITSVVSRSTSCVIVSNKEINTTKVKKAKEFGIPIYNKTEFIDKYKLNF